MFRTMQRRPHSHSARLIACLFVLFGPLVGATLAHAADYVWIEAENTTSNNLGDKLKAWGGWGNDKFLSEKKWAQVSIDADKVEKDLPEGGGMLSYKFTVTKGGPQEIWDRIGFEFVRSPFEWRLGGGDWKTVSPDELTTDLMPIEFFAEIAWLKLGDVNLPVGDHTLDIHLPKDKDKDKDGKYQKVNYTSDAILIYPGKFHPNSFHKPDDAGRTPADEAATEKVFDVPAATNGARSMVTLEGDWEVCRNDEQLPREVDVPIKDFPEEPHWTAIAVPSDKNKSRVDLQFAHRLWYRTRVNVPASQIGRSFVLSFPMNSLNTTVYVNGTYCGFSDAPLTRTDIDVTKGIKAGVNEVWVGIRDAWYGRTSNPDNPMKLRRTFNLPIKFFGDGFQDLDYPIWNNPQSGILEAPVLTVAGSTYASDVFVKPLVSQKQLAAEITLANPSNAAAQGEVAWAAINDKTGAAEKTFKSQTFNVSAGGTTTLNVADSWPNAKLWWPDQPNLYRLRTTVNVGGQPVDTLETTFGYREWSSRGTQFTLNGVNWPLWADLSPQSGKDPQAFLQIYRDTHQRTMRLMMPGQGGGQWRWYGMTLPTALDFFDRNGVCVRRNGMIDGEAIGYQFSEGDDALKKKYGTEIKAQLMRKWREQTLAQVRAERNHPSIQIWSIENEFAFINLINLLGNSEKMDEYEREISKISDAVMQEDPTRLVMTDGGGATKFQTLPVHGNHYVFNPADPRYPNLAYETNPEGGGRGRWVWDMKRPRFMGEDYFATGINPADYAQWGGEGAFLSKTAARPAADFIYRMLTEGYRWAGQSAWQFWSGTGEVVNPWNSQSPRAVFVRQYDWTFGSGQSIKRTYGVFNDTEYPDPLTFTRTLMVGGKKAWSKSTVHPLAPGTEVKFDETLPIPAVTARQDGQLILTLVAGGKEVFRDVKPLSILPPVSLGVPAANGSRRRAALPSGPEPGVKTPGREPAAKRAPHAMKSPKRHTVSYSVPLDATRLACGARLAAGSLPGVLTPGSGPLVRISAQMSPALGNRLVVYDPKNSVAPFLKNRRVAFTPINSLANLPANGRVLLIGPDALSEAESTSSVLAAYAASGRSVVVLDQANPLKYQALTAQLDTAPPSRGDFGQQQPTGNGSIGFPEDLNHPLMRGLRAGDFQGWGNDNLVYRNAYLKPGSGARSLLQVGPRLGNTALVEVPTGKGVMLLCQLTVGENVGNNAVAQQLLANLLSYGMTYKQEFRPVALVSGGNDQLVKAADAIGLQYAKAGDALAAISDPKIRLALVEATPANLKQLSSNMVKLNAFMQGGGYIMFHGLGAAGLEDYNKIVGFNHMIRPMRRERVTFPPNKDPLTSGMTTGDIVMLSGERIFGWTADEYVADDIFSAIVDYDDVAPFGTSDSYLYNNAVNNFTQADGWKLINNFDAPATGPAEIPIKLSKPQTITEFTWIGNTLYNGQTKVGLVFDGKDKVSWPVQPTNDPQTLPVNPPRTGQTITVQIQDWVHDKKNDKGNYVIGIDNIYLKAKRPADFYQKVKPMLNIGGLMDYPRGKGGMVLCNLLFKETEAVPVNAGKKRAIFGTLLRNLNAPFAGGKTVIAGAGLQYAPVDLHVQATQYLNERGWFGDKNFTFNALPRGANTFAGVTYNIYENATSPVPNVVSLGGKGVPGNLPDEVTGIPVNQKADALFFLQTARMDARRNDKDLRDNKKFEMARYVVHYADGQTAIVPVYAEINVDDWKVKDPHGLPGAQLAWTSQYPGTEFSAAAYSMQWNNPRPDVVITSVDLTYGPDRRGVPVLLALTAATAR